MNSEYVRKTFVDFAYNLFVLALNINSNIVHRQAKKKVAAICLYTVCRQNDAPILLLDFSDCLSINVYELGSYFLTFTRELNLAVPVIDNSLYMHR